MHSASHPSPPASQDPAVLLVHPRLAALVQHFAEWRYDYIGGVGENGNWVSLPGRLVALGLGQHGGGTPTAGQLSLIVEELQQHECMCWNAWDPVSRTRWSPFAESYLSFKLRYPKAQPLVLPCTAQRIHALRQFLGVT